ncbi:MAG TPA: hypothetical protein GXZ40_06360 [Bacteroidales bacterium]|nr:hypothetical protein [Bacteroidales bacterium]
MSRSLTLTVQTPPASSQEGAMNSIIEEGASKVALFGTLPTIILIPHNYQL